MVPAVGFSKFLVIFAAILTNNLWTIITYTDKASGETMAWAKELGASFICILLVLILSTGSLIAEYVNLKVCATTHVENDKDGTEDSRRISLSLVEDFYKHVNTSHSFFFPARVLHLGLFYLKDDKHLRTFYPTIPTPPPNVA